MIQDLGELQFDNQYKNILPQPEDVIISLKDGMIMLAGGIENNDVGESLRAGKMLSCDGGWDSPITYPTFGELPARYQNPADYRYAFSIGGQHYFLGWNLELEGYRYEKMIYLRKGSPKHNLYAGLMAMQIGRFYGALKFCGRCGHPMEHAEKERMMHCPQCGNSEYPKICPCVIVGVIHNGRILVSQYRNGARDHYALIAGFAEVGETIEECVHREVFEETHVHVKNLKFYKSQPWPFSDSLLFGFYCELDGDPEIRIDENELSMAKWVTPEELFEKNNDYALTNEMICKFKEDYEKYGKLML